jgi:hypothetical protein
MRIRFLGDIMYKSTLILSLAVGLSSYAQGADKKKVLPAVPLFHEKGRVKSGSLTLITVTETTKPAGSLRTLYTFGEKNLGSDNVTTRTEEYMQELIDRNKENDGSRALNEYLLGRLKAISGK